MAKKEIEIKEVSQEMEEFIMDLQEFASQWVDEVNEVILKHIEELFNDSSIRYLVKEYANEERKSRKFNDKYLFNAYKYGMSISRHSSIHNYNDALYQLCYYRFKEEK